MEVCMKDHKNNLAYIIGQFIGIVTAIGVAVCVGACIFGLAIASIIKFYALIF
jgi:hypothetical protein